MIAILGGMFILVNTLFTQFGITLVGIVATLIGVPVYCYLKKKNQGFKDLDLVE